MTASAPGPAPPPARTGPSRAQPTAAGPTPSPSAVSTTAVDALDSRPPTRNPSTPTLMLGMMTLCVALVVLFTTVAVVSLTGARSELSGAGRSVDQLGRIYAVQTELLRADAASAHRLLGAGAADPDPAEALGHARVLIVEAAEAEPRDRDPLAAVNSSLDDYVAALERARMAAGTPAAATALAEAGEQLRTEVLPALSQLTTENGRRVMTQTRGFPGYWLATTGILAIAALLVLTVQAAIRFRRVLNLGIVAAVILVAAALAVSGTALLRTHQAVTDTGRRVIPILGTTAEARTHGYDAHAQEALAVLAQDSDPAAQEPWDAAAAEARRALERPVLRDHEPGLLSQWTAYEETHEPVREHTLAGRWDAARSAAVESGEVFAAFDAEAASVMTDTAATVQQELSQPRARLLQGAVLSALAGLAAIACMVVGLRPRLREYR